MAPKYKLVYFDIRGRGEVTRLLFAQAGVEYEDVRVTAEEFAAMKNDVQKCPLGQLPVLMVDDRALPQSHAIERHLARTFGMYGKTDEEAAVIDSVVETSVDLMNPLIKIFEEKDDAKKAEMEKDYIEKGSVPFMNALCRRLQKNSEGKGYLVGNSMSLADVIIFDLLEVIFRLHKVLASKYPALKEFYERIKVEPKIASWLAKRPVTEY